MLNMQRRMVFPCAFFVSPKANLMNGISCCTTGLPDLLPTTPFVSALRASSTGLSGITVKYFTNSLKNKNSARNVTHISGVVYLLFI